MERAFWRSFPKRGESCLPSDLDPLELTQLTSRMPETPILTSRPRVLSGMRPTGKLHLGNYMGALRNWVKLQDQYDCYFFIADWHALTTDYADPSRVKLNTLDVALDWLAAGLDPNKSTIFIQSHVPQHAELHLLFSMITPLGWLERVPTYKEQQENLTGKDLSTYGFLGYPLLQAADILVYKAGYVPVGQDQVAHVELTREVARRFNQLYPKASYSEHDGVGKVEQFRFDVLPEPEVLLTPSPKLPGTDGRKMSKSYGNTIGLTEDPASVAQKLATMSTNGQRPRQSDAGDPDLCPVGDMHKLFSSIEIAMETQHGCRTASIGCKVCKALVAESISKHIAPIIAKRQQYEADIWKVKEILEEGANKAQNKASKTMSEVRSVMGISHDIGDIYTDRKLWSSVDYVINSISNQGWQGYIDQFRLHWGRKMVPREIGLKRPTPIHDNPERSLEEPYINASGKRVLVLMSESWPQCEKTPQGEVCTWHFKVPQKSYEVWALLVYRGDQVPTNISGANGEISAFILPQKIFSQEFALAKKSAHKGEKISIKIVKTQNNQFFLEFGSAK